MDFYRNIKMISEYIVIYEAAARVIGAVLIIILAITLRRFFVNVIVKLLKKITKKTKTDFDDNILNAIQRPARFAILVMGICLSMRILNLPIFLDVFIGKITQALINFAVFWALYRCSDTITKVITKISKKADTEIDEMLILFIRNGIKAVVVVLGAVTIIQIWQKDIAGIITGLGLGGLAFALAAKDTASNLFGGIAIMMDKPFTIGDWIKTPHVEGTVEEMGFRTTKVRTFAQAIVSIPNSTMSNDSITNWSRMGKRRITFRLGVTYKTTAEQLKLCISKIRKMLENHSDVHPETIFVYFEKFNDSSLDIFLYFFTKTTDWKKFLEIQEDINIKIMKILEQTGVEAAFPSRSIYIEKNKE